MATAVAVSEAEQAAGTLSEVSLAQLRSDLSIHGFCLLGPGVFPHAVLDRLGAQMDLFAAQLAAQEVLDKPGPERYWHLNGGIPRTQPFVHADVFANPLVEHAVATLLGPRCFMSFCGGNLNATCAGSGERRRWTRGTSSDTQFLHSDGPFVFPTPEVAARAGQPLVHSTTAVVVNFGTSDMTADTGATEIWPGSHLVWPRWTPTNSRGEVQKGEWPAPTSLEEVASELRQARAVPHPVPMAVPKGGCVIRDIRIWHRGVHNSSPWPRHQIALCYSADCVREATIVNSTGLRNLYELPRKPESELSCAGGFQPPLAKLQFCASCNEVFALPSPHGVDRNVQLVDCGGSIDCWGKPVATLEVAPRRHKGSSGGDADVEWSFLARASFNHLHASGATDQCDGTRRRVREAELPDWALAVFKREQACAHAKL